MIGVYMDKDKERTLVTFALIAYNQARFIREAVEGAFAQTYEPLEIIMSDDCSTDETFQIMQQLVAEYTGPHRVVLNHNETNLGIGAHINRIMELSHGELIVVAAGDDISLPHRSSEIYKEWIKSNKKAFSLDSKIEMIDEYGVVLTNRPVIKKNVFPIEQQLILYSKTLLSRVCGAAHAWHRDVFDVFGPLPSITMEDQAIPARAMLLGGVAHVDKTLVKYRTHGDNIWTSCKKLSAKELLDREVYYSKDWVTIYDDIVRCINDYKRTECELDRVREFDECVLAVDAGKKKNILKISILAGYPILRLFKLLQYSYLYKFTSNDIFWVTCAVSFPLARFLLFCKRKYDTIIRL
jgi:glycosyltransferase involved in cell wall biosynthesis